MNEVLLKILSRIIQDYSGIFYETLTFDIPPKSDLGDRAFGCFLLSKELKKSPAQIAQELQALLLQDSEAQNIFQKIEVAGPYINFFFSDNFYSTLLEAFFQNPTASLYGDVISKNESTIVIDYIGANVGKPLHIGHMCTPNQGQVFINLYRKLGYRVIADSHIGDWGIIFGRLIWAWKEVDDFGIHSILNAKQLSKYSGEEYGFKYSNIELIKNDILQNEGVDFLMQLYQLSFETTDESHHLEMEEEIRQEFKLLSGGNPESVKLWSEFTKYSIDTMRKTLARIGVQPDYDIGESFYEGIGLPKMQDYPDLKYPMKDIVEELLQKNIATKNEDGSVGVVFPEELKISSCILQKRDGTHGYLASDLASIKYRVENWNPEKIIYFVDVRQQLHLKQAFTIAKLATWIQSDYEIYHAYNGFISLKDGAMSTREGRIIKLEALFDEAQKRATDIIQEKRDDMTSQSLGELSEIIGIGAIKYGYLKKSRENDVIFDWDEFMSFEGNSGPYIQYSYVRAQKILEKGEKLGNVEKLQISEKEEKQLLAHLLSFPQVISSMQDGYHAHVLCQFVYEASKLFSALYANVPILQESQGDKKQARLKLLEMYTFIIENAFEILAIPLPQEM